MGSTMQVTEEGIEAQVLKVQPYVFVDVETECITHTNPPFERLFGYMSGELIGKLVHSLVPPLLRDRHVQHFAAFKLDPEERQMGTREMVLRGVTRKGEEVPVVIGLFPFVWPRDGRMYVLGIVQPVGRKS